MATSEVGTAVAITPLTHDGHDQGEERVGDAAHELFRRAIVEGDQAAWETVLAQYSGLVRGWLRRHPAARLGRDLEGDLINRTFERFWLFVRPGRFDTFAGLPALLQYLKLCTQSALIDELREREKAGSAQASADALPYARAFEGEVAGQLLAREIWQVIAAEMRNENELLIARLTLIYALKPQEIHERHPERFANVAEVYRVKRNLLERLRHNEAIRRMHA